ncbi:MAG: hypothetical protein KDI12_08680, partial [Anaerolineae bacterium]|nr:hypothetical protein [Anaerolineae bacterium]
MKSKAESFHRIRWVLLLAAISLAVALPAMQVLAAAGIWQSYVVINGVYYDANASTGNPDFQNQNLGTFTPGSAALLLSGGEVKTYKNNGTDVTSARLMYRVYPVGSPSGRFTPVNLPFAENLPNAGDQRWAQTSAGIDLLGALGEGNYTLEVYFEASTNGVDSPATVYDSNGGTNYSATFAIASTPGPITPVAAKALWLDTNTVAWNGAGGASYKLLYDPDGEMTDAAEAVACTFPAPGSPCYVDLTASGAISGYAKNPNATGLTRLLTGLSANHAKFLLTGELVVTSYDGGGARLDATRTQVQSVLDDLYVDNGTAGNAA